MEYEDLSVEIKDNVAVMTLNAPDVLNALTVGMTNSMARATGDIARDDSVKAVIVTGAGRAFCAGGDLKSMKERLDGTLEETRWDKIKRIGNWVNLFPALDKPVIAAVNGAAVGGGFSLAMACDIRIASEKAKFSSIFIQRGLVADSGTTYWLPRTVGLSKALELIWSGEMIDAAQAKSLGLVSRVVPPEKLMDEALQLAGKLARQPSVAIELSKRLVYRDIVDTLSQHIDCETYAQYICWGTEDFKENARAFLDKRPAPPFKGK